LCVFFEGDEQKLYETTDMVTIPIFKLPEEEEDHKGDIDHEFCFMCQYRAGCETNRGWNTLQKLFDSLGYGKRDLVYKNIQKCFNETFRQEIEGQPYWSIESIRRHAEEDGGVSEETMGRMIQQTLFKATNIIAQTTLLQHPVGEPHNLSVNVSNLQTYKKLAEQIKSKKRK
jgi:hypothetical protein